MLKESDIIYYVADGLGSVKKMIDNADNSVVNSYDYDSFGIPSGWTETVSNAYTYTSREWDNESGLYNNRTRYRDPQIGIFIQEDLINGFLTIPNTYNKYTYVLNNPLKYCDPSGFIFEWAPVIGTFELAIRKRTGDYKGLQLKDYIECKGKLDCSSCVARKTIGYFASIAIPVPVKVGIDTFLAIASYANPYVGAILKTLATTDALVHSYLTAEVGIKIGAVAKGANYKYCCEVK